MRTWVSKSQIFAFGCRPRGGGEGRKEHVKTHNGVKTEYLLQESTGSGSSMSLSYEYSDADIDIHFSSGNSSSSVQERTVELQPTGLTTEQVERHGGNSSHSNYKIVIHTPYLNYSTSSSSSNSSTIDGDFGFGSVTKDAWGQTQRSGPSITNLSELQLLNCLGPERKRRKSGSRSRSGRR